MNKTTNNKEPLVYKKSFIFVIFLSIFLLSGVLILSGVKVSAARAQSAAFLPSSITSDELPVADRLLATPATVITVTSGIDLDNSKSRTCASEPVCTLRRAIVQSRGLTAGELPVLISFDIPEDPAEGYNAALDVWELTILTTSDPSVFRSLKGQVIIDGETQPGGRANGPKIIIIGPGTGQKDGLIVGEVAGDNAIEIRGLAFQNFKTHITINTDNNFIENNWFGLASNGLDVYLRNDNPEDGSGSAGVALTSGADGNTIRNNVFAGLDGVAAAIRGSNNLFESNLVGTRADGSVPKQSNPSLVCTTVDWLGGGGVSVADNGSQIQNNVFAGLRQEVFSISTQQDAVRIKGDEHIVQNNQIGVDSDDEKVGVCGRGVYLAGANTPENTQVLHNQIVNPEMSAISINGALVDANLLRGNVIEKSTAWPQISGNPEPEAPIQFGATVPTALRDFVPAEVTAVNGTSVSGSSGANSPCPNCIIELFLDDTDTIVEALQSLAVVTADGSGNWTAVLPFELSAGQGLRTTSTSAQYNTIPGMSANTTTELSTLYDAGNYEVFLPALIRE